MSFKDAMIAASPALLGLAAEIEGRDPQGLAQGIGQMKKAEESAKRKAAIEGLMQSTGISGPEQALIAQLPVDAQAPYILDYREKRRQEEMAEKIRRQAAGRAAAAEARRQAERQAEYQALQGYLRPRPSEQGPTIAAAAAGPQVDRETVFRALADPRLTDTGRQTILKAYGLAQPGKREIIEGADGYKYFTDTGARVLPNVEQAPKAPSAAEQKIARLEELGLDREMAILIADGVLKVSRDPVSGVAQIVDARTGQPWLGSPGEPSGLPSTPTPPQQSPGALSPTVPEANYAGAFGAAGMGSNIANAGADALGIELPFPERQEASTALNNLALRTKTFMQQAFPGRASVQLMQELDKITAQPNRILMGEQRGRDMLEQTAGMIDALIAQEQRKLRNPRAYTPQMRAEARANIDALEQLSADYRAILESMGREDNANRTSSGVAWRIVE